MDASHRAAAETISTIASRDDALACDACDPLAPLRDRFVVPDDRLYFDGHSLGVLPRGVASRVRQMVDDEWGRSLIDGWNAHGWLDLSGTVGDKLAPLLGAAPARVVVVDTLSINLFKLLVAALDLDRRPGRRRVALVEREAFPTDRYLAASLADGPLARAGGDAAVAIDWLETADLEDPTRLFVGERAAASVLLVNHVDYRTGALRDLAGLTHQAHAAGARVLVDLAHSAGALPLALDAWNVDLAVGCTYKYLNGGPGAPGFLYASEALADRLRTPLPGWLGHRAPFAFADAYEPAPGVDRFRCGTPPILSLSALDAALDAWDGVDLDAVRAKAVALVDLFLRRVLDGADDASRRLGDARGRGGARDPQPRGSPGSLRQPPGDPLGQ
ncbi:MAG: aminotransferase class V-fold PLP-dependent enzyme, partial [Acidobacteriota bacterium]